jgi:hypothetical protein
MGKKGKPEESEQFEVWISSVKGWFRVEENGNEGVFVSKNRAMLLAESKSHGEEVVETMVISRRPIAVFNGEAIAVKHRLAAVGKKETSNAEVHSGRKDQVDVPEARPTDQPETGPGGAGREGAPEGR